MTEDESSARIVPVEILGQRYPVRSTLDAVYVETLAAYVDQKMRATAEVLPPGDPVRLAVLAALNIADELFRCREREELQRDHLRARALAVERLVDRTIGRIEGLRDED